MYYCNIRKKTFTLSSKIWEVKLLEEFNGFGCSGEILTSIKLVKCTSKERRASITMYDPDAPTGSGFGTGCF
jgi:phosphatidylethanolamine-binding protein (PEBP) family uncharacterized protein